MQHVEDSACSAVAGTMMRRREGLGTDSKKRLLKKSCPTVSRACTLQSSLHTCRDATTRTFLFVGRADKRKVTRLNESGHFAPSIMDLGIT